MMIPFTCKFPTYSEIADMLSKDIVICYWDYWNSHVFPFFDFYQEKGFKVIASSAASDYLFPIYYKRIPNIVGFAKRSFQYSNVIGNLITFWTDSGLGALWETAWYAFGIGLKVMQDSGKNMTEIEREVLRQVYGTDDRRLIDVLYLLSGLPGEADAPWKSFAGRKAKDILKELDMSNLGIIFLDIMADIYINKAEKVKVLFDIKKGRIDDAKARLLLEKVRKESEKVEQRMRESLKHVLKERDRENLLKDYFEKG